jgi:hypothetical protein
VAAVTPLRTGRTGALLAPAAVAAAAAAAVGVVAVVDPNEPGHYPTCPFLALTGAFCPGCGSLRAVHALAHGDLGLAVSLNLLAVLAVVPLVVIWLRWVRRSWAGASRRSVAPAPALWALVAVVVVFAVVRNLPVGAALAP